MVAKDVRFSMVTRWQEAAVQTKLAILTFKEWPLNHDLHSLKSNILHLFHNFD